MISAVAPVTAAVATSPAVDLDMAGRFLAALGNPPFCFRTFDDNKKRSRTDLARNFHGILAEHAAELTRFNRMGAGVFVVVNIGGDTDASITALRAVLVDADDVPLPAVWAMEPDIIVKRSDVRWHAYWLLSPGAPLAAFTPAQKHLAKFYGSDPVVCNLSRVMRLPGFAHMKGAPTAVRMVRP